MFTINTSKAKSLMKKLSLELFFLKKTCLCDPDVFW